MEDVSDLQGMMHNDGSLMTRYKWAAISDRQKEQSKQ